jgi:holliday junction DNA helicase RuvB
MPQVDRMERHEINEVAPTSLSHVIGQEGVVAQVAVALDAAQQDGKKFDDALLVGGAGLGKTQVAKIIAGEMCSGFQEILGQSLASPADFNALLLGAKGRDVILIDEAHELKRVYQTALYVALDQRQVFLQGRSGGTPQSIPLADFTLLLATTDEFKLLQPLRDRMKLTLRFEFYSPEDLVELLRQRCRGLGWSVDDKVYQPIAQRSRGTPRLALRLLQSCRRVCRAEGEDCITPDHLVRACLLEGIDPLGLGPTEQHYLRILAEGDSRLNVIASNLGLPPRTVSEVSEPFLIRSGLMMKDDQGRRLLTAEGRDHLSRSRPNGV